MDLLYSLLQRIGIVNNAGQLTSAINAALIAGSAAIFASIISSCAQICIARKKANDDIKLSIKKFEFDKKLAEDRIKLEVKLSHHKRKCELAEQVLSDFYSAQRVISYARHPISTGSEGKSRPRSEDEAAADSPDLDNLYVPIERLNEEKELFLRLRINKPRFQANFGNEEAEPFDEIIKVYNDIIRSSQNLITTRRYNKKYSTGLVQQWQNNIWSGHEEPDSLCERVNRAVAHMDIICGKIIRENIIN